MRFAPIVPVIALASGAVACTALLGDFSVGRSSDNGGEGDLTGADSGSDSPGVVGTPVISPVEAKVGILRAQRFTATSSVTWSIQEGAAGGNIDDSGRFIATENPGVVHVIATSKDDPSKVATATVTVAPLGIRVLAGPNGGEGNIDGPPLRAHFRRPGGIGHLYNGSNTHYYIADTDNHTIRDYDEQQQKVTTLAGSAGEPGAANGIGAQARFNRPTSIAVDANSQKVYVVDSGNDCIRAIEIASGNVTTVTGRCGSPGSDDGSKGIPAQFSNVRTITLNGGKRANQPASALYVADAAGTSLRRVALTGLLPGTAGNAKTLFATSQSDVAADFFSGGSGDLFIYFTDGGTLKRFRDSAPILSREEITGTPEEQSSGLAIATGFGGQNELLFASGNNSLVASGNNSLLYRFQIDTKNFDKLPLAGVKGDSRVIDGPFETARLGRPTAVDVLNDRSGAILIADTEASAIRSVDESQRQVTTFIGAAHIQDRINGSRNSARFTNPFGIATDDAGNTYIADVIFDGPLVNNTIRKIDMNGVVSSFSGKPVKLGPDGIAVDGKAFDATYGFPSSLTFVNGNIYVLDIFSNAIRKVSSNGDVTTIAGELGIAGSSDGIGAAAHFAFYATSGKNEGAFGSSIATDGTDLFVSDPGNFSIRKVALATGKVTTLAGGTKGTANGVGAAAQFVAPAGLTVDAGFLYITDFGDHTIRKMDLKTNEVTTLIGISGQPGTADGDAGTARLNSPLRIQADHLGNLYTIEIPLSGDVTSSVIRRMDIKQRRIGPFAGQRGKIGLSTGPLPSTVNCPFALTLTRDGDLTFADLCETTIATIAPL